MSDRLIELKGIKKCYKDKEVLKGIDLIIDKGQMVVIRGASGSGKSTLMNILGLLDDYDDGIYKFEDVKIKKRMHTDIRAERIGFIFQSYNLIESMSVIDNILTVLMYCKASIDRKKLEYIDETLNNLNIFELKNKNAGLLSGGEKQRVAIARAFAKNPKLIIADEPTGNLDEKNAVIINKYFKKMTRKGTSVVVVTHSNQIFLDADKAYYLEEGKLKI